MSTCPRLIATSAGLLLAPCLATAAVPAELSVKTSSPVVAIASGGAGLWTYSIRGTGSVAVPLLSRISATTARPLTSVEVDGASGVTVSNRYAWTTTTHAELTRITRSGQRTSYALPPSQSPRVPTAAFGQGGLWVSGLCDDPTGNTPCASGSSYVVDEATGSLAHKVSVPDALVVGSISTPVGGPWLVAAQQQKYVLYQLNAGAAPTPLTTAPLPNRYLVPVTKSVVWAVPGYRARPGMSVLRFRPGRTLAGVPSRGKQLIRAIPDGCDTVWLLERARGKKPVTSLRPVAASTGRSLGATIVIRRHITVDGTYAVTATYRGSFVWIALPNDHALLRVRVNPVRSR